jgi:hypothetical protein
MKIVTLPFLYIFSLFFIQKLNPLLSIEVPIGGNTFQTKGANLELLDKDGIKTWTSTESVWSTYIFSGSEKKITLSLELTEIPSKNNFIVVESVLLPHDDVSVPVPAIRAKIVLNEKQPTPVSTDTDNKQSELLNKKSKLMRQCFLLGNMFVQSLGWPQINQRFRCRLVKSNKKCASWLL